MQEVFHKQITEATKVNLKPVRPWLGSKKVTHYENKHDGLQGDAAASRHHFFKTEPGTPQHGAGNTGRLRAKE